MNRVFHNARVVTMDRRLPEAEAVIIRNGKILQAGSSEELISAAGDGAEKIDLGGKMVLPGLTDSHTHLFLHACRKRWMDLSGARSAEDIIYTAGQRDNIAGDWILGRGWDQNMMDDPALPSLEIIDSVTGDSPAFLERICGHAALINSAALSRAGLERGSSGPEGGRVLWENGLVQDEAVDIIRLVIDTPSTAARKELLSAAAEEMLSMGITGVHDMGMTAQALESYAELAAGGDLRIRITGYLPGAEEEPENTTDRVEEAARNKNDFLSVPGVKLFADGSLGARTAALTDPYSDDPGNRGIIVTDRNELRRRIEFFHSCSVQTAVHAIGDLANRMTLDILEQVLGRFPEPHCRHRIEHAQIIGLGDIPRFSSLGIIPSMQFSHYLSDSGWMESRLGRKRMKMAYPWRSLADSGSAIAAGSDLPFEKIIDPFSGLQAAVTRPGNESLTLHQALEGYTVNAAFASFDENRRGSISPGMDADLIVISRDIQESLPETISETEVLATVVAGEIAYSSENII